MWPHKIRRRVPEYIRWKFKAADSGEVDNFFLAIDQGMVVGQVGLVHELFKIGDDLYNTYWIVDFKIHPERSGEEIAPRLFKKAIEGKDIVMVNDPDEDGLNLMKKIGFREIEGPKKMLFPINFHKVLAMKLSARKRFIIPLLSFFVEPFYYLQTFKIQSYKPKKVEQVNWKTLVPDIQILQKDLELPHSVHNEDFLNWRCSTFKDFNKEPKAIKTENGSFAIYIQTSNSLYVYEWFAHDKQDTLELYSYMLKEAKLLGLTTISTVSNFHHQEHNLKYLGFIAMRKTLSTQLYYPPDHRLSKYPKFYYTLYDADENI
ncbi:hypothetical protein [Splendidivirga corallicola]